MKILLSGGSGHVGGAIKNHLLALDQKVVCASRSGDIRVDLSCIRADDQIVEAMQSCDIVVHCAACIAKSAEDHLVTLANCLGTQNVIQSAKRLGAKVLVYISSLQVIGKPIHLPITETHPTMPLTLYHSSKLFGENLVNIANSSTLRTVTLRIPSPIGPNTPRGRIFSEFVHNSIGGNDLTIIGQGTRRQNYVDVRDVAIATANCLNTEARGIYNIAGSNSFSNLELAHACINTLSSRSSIAFTGANDPEEGVCWEVSIDKALKELEYQPRYSIYDSIRAAAGI
jgi:UDP-glucose 4-epimerase